MYCSPLNSPSARRGAELAVHDIQSFKTLVVEVTVTTLRCGTKVSALATEFCDGASEGFIEKNSK